MKELWDLFDEERKPLGKTHERGTPVAEGHYHVVVEIWTVNAQKQLLVTKRHPDKKAGGLWECTGGAVQAGETSMVGAQRELKEETSIAVSLEALQYLGSMVQYHGIVDTYKVNKDVEVASLSLQAEEVTDAKWVDEATFIEMCERGEVVESVKERFGYYRDQILG